MLYACSICTRQLHQAYKLPFLQFHKNLLCLSFEVEQKIENNKRVTMVRRLVDASYTSESIVLSINL